MVEIRGYEFFAPIIVQNKLSINRMIDKDTNFLDLLFIYEGQFRAYFYGKNKKEKNLHMRLRIFLSKELMFFSRKHSNWNSKNLKNIFDNILKININTLQLQVS